MAIYQSNKRGSLIIERRIRGLGKLRCPTGCPPTLEGRATAEGMEKMLLVLAGPAGRRDVVRSIMRRQLHLQDVWPYYSTGRWDRIPTAEQMRRAFPVLLTEKQRRRKLRLGAVGQWLPTYRTSRGELSPSHRRRMTQAFKELEKLSARAKVGELPELIRQYRERCEATGHHRAFQLTKAAVQSFLRSTLGRRQNPLWGEVADIPTLKPGEGKSTKRAGRKFSPAEARAIRDRLPGQHGAQWWDLCRTGMMPDEYFNRKFVEEPDRIHVEGTKRRHEDAERQGRRRRNIPRLGPVAGPVTTYRQFTDVLHEATNGDVRPYDARHTYAHWMQRAGIDPIRRKVYRGHSAQTMEELYEEDTTGSLLARDAEALNAYIGPEPEPPIRLVRSA